MSLSDYEVMASCIRHRESLCHGGAIGWAPAVHLTVASDDGQPLSASPTLRRGLMQTLLSLGDSTQPLFWMTIARAIPGRTGDCRRQRLSPIRWLPSSAQRWPTGFLCCGDFGNSVRAADVLNVAQSVPGVLGAVLSGLWFDGSPQSK